MANRDHRAGMPDYRGAAVKREGRRQRCVDCRRLDGRLRKVPGEWRWVRVKIQRDHPIEVIDRGPKDHTVGRCTVCHNSKTQVARAARARRRGQPVGKGKSSRKTKTAGPVARLCLAVFAVGWLAFGVWLLGHPVDVTKVDPADMRDLDLRGFDVAGATTDAAGVGVRVAVVGVVLVLAGWGLWRWHRRRVEWVQDTADALGVASSTDTLKVRLRVRRWRHGFPTKGTGHYASFFDADEDGKGRAGVQAVVNRLIGDMPLVWDTRKRTYAWDATVTVPEPTVVGVVVDAHADDRRLTEERLAVTVKDSTVEWLDADAEGPTVFLFRYPAKFNDDDPAARTKVLDQVEAKLGGRWRATWDTRRNVARFERRPVVGSLIRNPGRGGDPARIPLGLDEDGREVVWDLKTYPHCLIAGATLSGKTVALRTVITGAAIRGYTQVMCDPKRIELAGLRGFPGVRVVATSTQDMVALVTMMADEMDARYTAIENREVNEDDLEPVLLVVDELAEFIIRVNKAWATAGNRGEHPVVERLQSMARLSRAGRIHLVVGIQRPDTKIIGGEALALDTPIPTPDGWTTMGAIKADDWVLGADGRPVRVSGVTEVAFDRPCYRVAFSDGASIVADANHLWEASDVRIRYATERRIRRTASGLPVRPIRSAPVVVTTEQIAQSVRDRDQSNWSVRIAAPLDLPHVDLPVDPWLLGYWLGDGDRNTAAVATADEEVLDRIRNLGYGVTHHSAYNYGINTGGRGGDSNRRPTLKGALRDLAVLGNKHVPAAYLRASRAQRAELLAGLLDSDGTVARSGGRSGQVAFTNVDRGLIDAVAELAVSLGFTPYVRTCREAGIECGVKSVAHGRATRRTWRVTFTPDRQVFGIARKQEALAASLAQTRRPTMKARYIVAVEPVESVPVRCIEVDSDEHLYLAGRSMIPTHNCRDNFGLRMSLGPMSPDGTRMMFGRTDVGRGIPPDAKGRAAVGMGEDEYREVQTYYTPNPWKVAHDWEPALLASLADTARGQAFDAVPDIDAETVRRYGAAMDDPDAPLPKPRRKSKPKPPPVPDVWDVADADDLAAGLAEGRVQWIQDDDTELRVVGVVESPDEDGTFEVEVQPADPDAVAFVVYADQDTAWKRRFE